MTVQLSRKQWTREEYLRLADLDFFEGQRVELMYGEILRMSPQKKPHALTIGRLTTVLVRVYGETHIVRVQCPLDLTQDSQPEPDIAVVPIAVVEEADPHPGTADLVVEISASSLNYDRREKGALYALAGIPSYWLFNLKNRSLEVYTLPAPLPSERTGFGYKSRVVYGERESVSLPGSTQLLELSKVFP